MRNDLTTGLLILAVAWSPMGFTGQQTSTPASTAPTSQPVIRSQAELARYLEQTPRNAPPLGWLSPGGRKRFLAELKFGSRGLAGVPLADPSSELTHRQIVALFSLFGVQEYAQGLGLTQAERERRRHERMVAAEARGCRVDVCPESPIEKAFDQLILHSDPKSLPLPQRAAAIARAYDRLFTHHQSPQSLSAVDAPDLRLLKRAAENVLFYAPDAARVGQLRNDLAEMHKRGMTTDESYTGLYKALVATRRFGRARTLAQKHPGMSITPLPVFDEPVRLPPGQPTALSLGNDGKTMTRQAFNLDAPLRIVVVASCHFSQDAARAIKNDKSLRAVFTRDAIWLASQGDAIATAGQWSEWNREFPSQPIHIAWNDSEWSMLDSWAMPTFYIFRHGKLIDQWSGWPADTGMRTLRRHLHDDGILK